MSPILELIGLVSGVLGIVGFFQDQFPSKPEDEPKHEENTNIYTTTLRIQLGVNGIANPETGETLWGAGGSAYTIDHYGANGIYLFPGAMVDTISAGSFQDLSTSASIGDQVTRTEIADVTDDMCIATMGMTLADGTHWGWLGDVSIYPKTEIDVLLLLAC